MPFEIRKGLPRLAYLTAARRASAVMAVSAGTRSSVCDVGVPPDKVVVVPNAVRPEQIAFDPEGRERVRKELGIPSEAFVVGCVARFHPKKRNDVVVDAVSRLDGSAHLTMAGDGESEDALRRQAEPLGSGHISSRRPATTRSPACSRPSMFPSSAQVRPREPRGP